MMKSTTINARIEPEVKSEAEKILHEIGLSSAEAIRIFYKQICVHHGLPFDVKIPNKETLKAMHEADKGIGLVKCENKQDLFDKLGI